MDRNAIIRWIVIAVAVLGILYLQPKMCNKSGGGDAQPIPTVEYKNAPDFPPDAIDAAGLPAPPPGETCTLKTSRFEADLSTRGAGLTHFRLLDERYAKSEAADMSTTPDIERWRNLRTEFGKVGVFDQLKYDRFNWKLKKLGDEAKPTGCEFTYEDEAAKIVKTVSIGERPFELTVETKLTNLADGPRRHRFSIGTFAYRQNKEMSGSLGRQSPFQTQVSCAVGEKVERKGAGDFKTGWAPAMTGIDRYAAISNFYFAQALVPADVPPPNTGGSALEKPECSVLAEAWAGANQKIDDDEAAKVFHTWLTYPARTLQKSETASYREVAFFGPKERPVLKAAAGGNRGLTDLIDLGFWTPVCKVLVSILTWFHDNVTMGHWGIAIILLTLCVRLTLFPLTWKQIKSSIAMRKLKPEIDALNEKFKDDAQAKNVAMMELWRKHKVNPLGGCLPMLVQMPVWFAMYTTLQTAPEMYHTKFLWFADLSAPDRFFVLPILLGGFMILQQRIVPQQGMDPMQQKMMTWLMPIIFTVMMLFLPAALGVYMLTNSILGIVQQLVIERIAPRGPTGGITVKSSAKGTPASFGKGKARV